MPKVATSVAMSAPITTDVPGTQTGPRNAPVVTWFFWAQFDLFERLEELRQFRPALFKGLAEEPGLGARDSGPGSAKRKVNAYEDASATEAAVSGSESASPESRVPDPEPRP